MQKHPFFIGKYYCFLIKGSVLPVCVVWDFEFLPDEQATLTRDVARRYAVTERERITPIFR